MQALTSESNNRSWTRQDGISQATQLGIVHTAVDGVDNNPRPVGDLVD